MGKNDVAMAEVNKTPRKVNHFKVLPTCFTSLSSSFKFHISTSFTAYNLGHNSLRLPFPV